MSKDSNASLVAQILKINPNTISRYYNLFREAILKESILMLEKEKEEIPPVIEGKILEESTISDAWKAYDGLLVNGYEH